jgi:hypothetical protein
MRATWMLALATLLLPSTAFAQAAATDEDFLPERDDRPQLRVLEDPYDLASFYRADSGRPGLEGARGFGRYPIAGYYRGETNPNGWSRFWTNGYRGDRQRGAVLAFDYRAGIGQNGDLYLLAPTFLAPVGPLSDFFFYSRSR